MLSTPALSTCMPTLWGTAVVAALTPAPGSSISPMAASTAVSSTSRQLKPCLMPTASSMTCAVASTKAAAVAAAITAPSGPPILPRVSPNTTATTCTNVSTRSPSKLWCGGGGGGGWRTDIAFRRRLPAVRYSAWSAGRLSASVLWVGVYCGNSSCVPACGVSLAAS